MSEEEKKAIRNLENLSEFGLSATLNQADLDKMKIVLNLIEKQKNNIALYKQLYEDLENDFENYKNDKDINYLDIRN